VAAGAEDGTATGTGKERSSPSRGATRRSVCSAAAAAAAAVAGSYQDSVHFPRT
tara:strand:+ start:801 stop:962 length:162 start_codon:yes stop_codon:yes gene_type:complete